MTTKQGNKLIMAFMELKPVYVFGRYSISKDHCTCVEDTEEQAIDGFAGIAKYHKDWNWLMPVVGKISNQCEQPEELDGLKYALLCDDINTAWNFITDYLHNQQNDQ